MIRSRVCVWAKVRVRGGYRNFFLSANKCLCVCVCVQGIRSTSKKDTRKITTKQKHEEQKHQLLHVPSSWVHVSTTHQVSKYKKKKTMNAPSGKTKQPIPIPHHLHKHYKKDPYVPIKHKLGCPHQSNIKKWKFFVLLCSQAHERTLTISQTISTSILPFLNNKLFL